MRKSAKKTKSKTKAKPEADGSRAPKFGEAPPGGKTRRGRGNAHKRNIQSYDHKGQKRLNNPPVGLVSSATDQDSGKKRYAYDPHLDPKLDWAGKVEHTSFEVDTVSLHVHERIDPRTIIEAVRKRNGNGNGAQLPLFQLSEENPPLREAIEFYKHPHNWANRLIAGDSLLVMNSLLEKEGMAGKVQMVYIDPPYGIKYGSNFQPFVNRREVKDGKDDDLSQEPEMIRAFRDTWELGIHSYLTYLRDRLLLAKQLLTEKGSCFVQISDENVHLVRNLMDEVFGTSNFCALIAVQKTSARSAELVAGIADYIIWYARNKDQVKFRRLFTERAITLDVLKQYKWIELPDGNRRQLKKDELENPQRIPKNARLFRPVLLTSSHEYSLGKEPFKFDGKKYLPGSRYWSTSPSGLKHLAEAGRLLPTGDTLNFLRYLDDFAFIPIADIWTDTPTGGGSDRYYVVQTTPKVISRCLLMTTDPGDLVFDPTCGSGTTAVVAEQWGRRWITCDTSRVALTLAKQRLMTAMYDYYELAYPDEGVASGFRCKTVPHITLKSIANSEPPLQESLYDQPSIDKKKVRVSGPLTVEAVPAPIVKSPENIPAGKTPSAPIVGTGEALRQDQWRDELLNCGIRAKASQRLHFTRVEPLSGTHWLHAEGETKESTPQRVVVSFGPEHAPLEQRQVEKALEEAGHLVPKPKIVVFASFHFDPEAAKDIDETKWPSVTLLKVQMNTDLLTDDLKKKRSSNESFWMIGQPDVELKPIKKGADKGKWQVEVRGFDYYNPKTGRVESGDTSKIAMWMLDPDYDGRSLYPRQVFFPMASPKEGWAKLAKNLKAEIDPELIEAYRGTVSIPFEVGQHKRGAIKIIDDRGIESLRILELK